MMFRVISGYRIRRLQDERYTLLLRKVRRISQEAIVSRAFGPTVVARTHQCRRHRAEVVLSRRLAGEEQNEHGHIRGRVQLRADGQGRQFQHATAVPGRDATVLE